MDIQKDHGRVLAFPERRHATAKSPNLVDRHVGMRIKQQRLSIGMSQEKLAESLGITFQQVQKYEKGINRIGAGRLLQICEVLGVAIGYLFEGHPTNAAGSGTSDLQALLSTREGLALAQAFARIDNSVVRQALVAVAQAAGQEP